MANPPSATARFARNTHNINKIYIIYIYKIKYTTSWDIQLEYIYASSYKLWLYMYKKINNTIKVYTYIYIT